MPPREEKPHRTTERQISNDYIVEYDHEIGWLALLFPSGFRINLSPESIKNLRDLLNEVVPTEGKTDATE